MFVIDENNSISWTDGKQFDGLLFGNLEGLEQIAESRAWTKQTVTDAWNGFAGTAGPFADLKPMKCFKNRPYGLRKIWDAIQRLAPGTVTVKLACEDEASATFAAVGRAARKLANAANARLVPSDAASEPAAPLEAMIDKGLEKLANKKAKAKKAPKAKPAPVEAKAGSNLDQLIKMIGRKQGASIEEVMARTGWSATHTVRGRISILKSKGVPIESFKHETRGRVYRTA